MERQVVFLGAYIKIFLHENAKNILCMWVSNTGKESSTGLSRDGQWQITREVFFKKGSEEL